MKKEIVKIVILSKDTKRTQKIVDAINQESKYFKEEIEVISDIQELDKINDIKILIYIVSNKTQSESKKYSYEELENKADRTIILDGEKGTIQNKDTINNISRYEDCRAIAFAILYDYYLEMKKKIKEDFF